MDGFSHSTSDHEMPLSHRFGDISAIGAYFTQSAFEFRFDKIDSATKSRGLDIVEDLIKKIGVWITPC